MRLQAGVTPPTTLGISAMPNFPLAGSIRSGEKARKKSTPTRAPRAWNIGNSSSSVVPGYVVDVRRVRPAGVQRGDAIEVGVEAGGGEPGPGELHGEREADVALPDHGETRGPVTDAFGQSRFSHRSPRRRAPGWPAPACGNRGGSWDPLRLRRASADGSRAPGSTRGRRGWAPRPRTHSGRAAPAGA